MKGECALISVPSEDGEVTDLLPVLRRVLRGKARWWRLERGKLTYKVSEKDVTCGRVPGPPRAGGERQKETPSSLTRPTPTPGPRLETWEREEDADALCPLLSEDVAVLGHHGKHLEGVVRVQLPQIQEEIEQSSQPRLLVFQAFPGLQVLVGFSFREKG